MITSKQWTTAFMTRYRTADLKFINFYWSNNEDMTLTILYGLDPDFNIFQKVSPNYTWDFMGTLKSTLADKSRWPFVFAQILAPSPAPGKEDIQKLRETPEFIVWKTSLYDKFQLDPKHRFFTLITTLKQDWSDTTVMGHEIHEKLEDGFEGKWLKFVERF